MQEYPRPIRYCGPRAVADENVASLRNLWKRTKMVPLLPDFEISSSCFVGFFIRATLSRMRCPAGFRSGTNPVYHVQFPSWRYSKTCWPELSSVCRRHSTLCRLQARNNRSGLLSTDSGLLGSDAGVDEQQFPES